MRSKKLKLVELRGNLTDFPHDRVRYWTSDHETGCQIWTIPVDGNSLIGFMSFDTGKWRFVEDHAKVFAARYREFFDEIADVYNEWFVEVE